MSNATQYLFAWCPRLGSRKLLIRLPYFLQSAERAPVRTIRVAGRAADSRLVEPQRTEGVTASPDNRRNRLETATHSRGLAASASSLS
jgi:hypothetical protein